MDHNSEGLLNESPAAEMSLLRESRLLSHRKTSSSHQCGFAEEGEGYNGVKPLQNKYHPCKENKEGFIASCVNPLKKDFCRFVVATNRKRHSWEYTWVGGSSVRAVLVSVLENTNVVELKKTEQLPEGLTEHFSLAANTFCRSARFLFESKFENTFVFNCSSYTFSLVT